LFIAGRSGFWENESLRLGIMREKVTLMKGARGHGESIWGVLRIWKWMILTILLLPTFLTMAYVMVYGLPFQPLFQSRCVIAPEDVRLENPFKTTTGDAFADQSFMRWAEIEFVLSSPEMAYYIVQRYGLAQKLLPRLEPDTDKAPGPSPTMLEASRYLRKMIKIKWDDVNKAVVLMSFSQDPELCKQVLHYYLDSLDFFLRERAGDIIDLQLMLLKVQYIEEKDEKIRAGLTLLMRSQAEKRALTQKKGYYGFDLVAEPTSPQNHSLPSPTVLKYFIFPLNVILLSLLAVMALCLMRRASKGQRARKPESDSMTKQMGTPQ
jgi:hypothetical protein